MKIHTAGTNLSLGTEMSQIIESLKPNSCSLKSKPITVTTCHNNKSRFSNII